MSVEKPLCVALRPWLKANLGKRILAGLTGTDARALDTFIHAVSLYSYSGSAALFPAMAAIVREMQPSMRFLAYHSIAHAMDWSHRGQLWRAMALPEIERVGVCNYEPGGRGEAGDETITKRLRA